MALTWDLLVNVETLGPLVRKRRERRGIRAADLAFRIGKDPSYLSKLERDLLKEIPEPDVIAALSRELELPEIRLIRSMGFLAGHATDDTPNAPAAAYADILEVLDRMNEREREALARIGADLIELRQPESVARPGGERLSSLA